MFYFAYGSNMSFKRLQYRISSSQKIATAILKCHQLRFHKASMRDGSAKADAFETENHLHQIHGVLFKIAPMYRSTLDNYEGVGKGYEVKNVFVELPNGAQEQAFTYYATHIDPSLKPFDWYKEHVLVGARENALPTEYINIIESIECIYDADSTRKSKELAIYETLPMK